MNIDTLIHSAAGQQWSQIGVRNHHGICIPLFSLHTEKSCGIGEYYDLLPMIQWCRELGMNIIQLLPLNDIGLDTSPYSSISAFALSPIHLSISELPGIEAISDFKEKLSKLRYWTRTHRVKYHIIRELKFAFLREYYSRIFPEISTSSIYKQFLLENQYWLEPYALFKALKEANFWKNWEDWPNSMKSPSNSGYQELLKQYTDACSFHSFLQFLCFQQFETVKKYADDREVLLKGDIPILISKDSADVWYNKHFFLLHLAAGAPPDMYSRVGQYWGFPLYDWEALAHDDHSWWKQRLRIASHLYHLYRIDHVVGFFRMWAIALGKRAVEGSFIPMHENEWIDHGRKLMEMMLHAAPILPIGEDLGLVPTAVKECLYRLGICGTKMMRWERRWEQDGGFIPVQEYQPMTMTTVSTHDSDTLQLWWRHFPKEAKLFAEFKGWPYTPFLSQEYHEEILRDSHHSSSLFHINLLQEYLALFPELVSQNPHNERINIPGKVLDTNWTYRFKPTVEKMVTHIPLREKILSILKP